MKIKMLNKSLVIYKFSLYELKTKKDPAVFSSKFVYEDSVQIFEKS